jgi:glycosyltransferase 2 family protein
VFGLALGVGLMVWFLGSLHWNELGQVMRDISWIWLLAAIVVMMAQYALLAVRWGVLLRHVDPGINFRLLWSATAVMWGFNTLLPLRAGNFLRPAVVARERQLPYTTLLFTTIAEYVCDTVGIVVMLLWMIALLPPERYESGFMAPVKLWGPRIGIIALVSLFIIVLLSSRQARTFVQSLLMPIPSKKAKAYALGLFDQLVEGMAAVGHPLRLFQALVLTLGVWGGWLVAILCVLEAFAVDLPLDGALFMESSLTLSMMLPQAPGFLGLFQVVTEQTLAWYDTPVAKAEGVALVFWSVCFIPITLVGLYEGSKRGLGLLGNRGAVFDELVDEAE